MSSYPTQNGNAQRNKQQPMLVGLGGREHSFIAREIANCSRQSGNQCGEVSKR